MKHLILPIACAALLFTACKESAPAIDFGPKASDTTFEASPEAPQQRVVVIEEFTGVTCTNCPTGHALIKSFIDANPDRVISLGIQIKGFSQGDPVDHNGIKTIHDNRTQDGTDLANGVFGGVSAMPTAAFDRVPVGGIMLNDTRKWAGSVASRLAVPAPANVTLTSTYNASTRQAFIKVHVAYTSTITKAQKLTVALLENNIVDAQEGSVFTGGFEQNYNHQHVLRDILTAPTGNAILGDIPSKGPGRVYERTFVYTVDAAWKAEDCNVVAYVSNDDGTNKEILQGAEVHLK